MSEVGAPLAQRYVLESPIAEGGMATVWRARDDVLARPVTIKILHPELAIDPGFIDSFRTEALAAARLAHANIVAIYDTGSEGEGDDVRHFIVMEYCGGGDLAALLRREGSLSVGETERLAADVCAALEYAHSEGILHRDIKPQNILFSDQGAVKVGDFAIARSVFEAGDVDTTTSLLGNVTYISPEQALNQEGDERSDVYSLGVLLYHCLVGRPPFDRDTALSVARAHINEEPPPLRSIKAHIPRALDGAVLRALAKDPDDRYDSVGELLQAFRTAADADGSTQMLRRPARLPPPASRERRRPRAAILMAAFAVGALVTAGLLFMGGREDAPPDRSGDNGGNSQEEMRELDVVEVSDLDPHGDGSEHPEEAPLAADGDESTTWTTQDYRSPLSIFKPDGFGLWFDLGQPRRVDEVEVLWDEGGYGFELRAGQAPGEDESDFDLVFETEVGEQRHRAALDEAVEARFWLVWIRTFPGDRTGTGAIAEVRFFGS